MESEIHLSFNESNRTALNVCLGIVMFCVALELKPEHFRRVFLYPKSPLVGLISHFLLLPLITIGLIWLLKPPMGFALGMVLIAACPGGNVANFLASMGKANVALSVSLTATSEVLAIVMTPLTFLFWSRMIPGAEDIPAAITLDPLSIIGTVFMIIGVPLILGMSLGHFYPKGVARILKPAKILSMLILVSFIVFATLGNKEAFKEHAGKVLLIVIIHNALALLGGYLFGKLWRLPEADARTVSVQTGIQNAGLGLVLIFNFFGGYGEMALVAALWGIWHIVSGSLLAFVWSRFPPKEVVGQ